MLLWINEQNSNRSLFSFNTRTAAGSHTTAQIKRLQAPIALRKCAVCTMFKIYDMPTNSPIDSAISMSTQRVVTKNWNTHWDHAIGLD